MVSLIVICWGALVDLYVVSSSTMCSLLVAYELVLDVTWVDQKNGKRVLEFKKWNLIVSDCDVRTPDGKDWCEWTSCNLSVRTSKNGKASFFHFNSEL